MDDKDKTVKKDPTVSSPTDLVSLLQQEAARGSTNINLSDRQLSFLPPEICQLRQAERLGLNGNLLAALPRDLPRLSNLRYLNLKGNHIREFPLCLCEMPVLEILDISRNKLKGFPSNPGTLMNLKVWSLSKNRFTTLPGYICKMEKLVVFKIDRNPLQWPPSNITELVDDSQMTQWLASLKKYLQENESSRPDKVRPPSALSTVSSVQSLDLRKYEQNLILQTIQPCLRMEWNAVGSPVSEFLFRSCISLLLGVDTLIRSFDSLPDAPSKSLFSSVSFLINCLTTKRSQSATKHALLNLISDLSTTIGLLERTSDLKGCHFQTLGLYGMNGFLESALKDLMALPGLNPDAKIATPEQKDITPVATTI